MYMTAIVPFQNSNGIHAFAVLTAFDGTYGSRALTACDKAFETKVTSGVLNVGISSRLSVACISGIEVKGKEFTKRITCGGGKWQDYASNCARAHGSHFPAAALSVKNRSVRPWAVAALARPRGRLFGKEGRSFAQMLTAIVLIQLNSESGLVVQFQVAVFNQRTVMLYDLLSNSALKCDT